MAKKPERESTATGADDANAVRRRRTRKERLAGIKEKMKALVAERDALAARAREDEKRIETRRKLIVGSAQLARAARDSEHRTRLAAQLAEDVTRASERAVIADLLSGTAMLQKPGKASSGEYPRQDSLSQ